MKQVIEAKENRLLVNSFSWQYIKSHQSLKLSQGSNTSQLLDVTEGDF